MTAFCALIDVSADFAISYRPSSNGIVERKNGNVLVHFRGMLFTNMDIQKNWYHILPLLYVFAMPPMCPS